jgi:uncharacterized membrane protein YfcA
VSVTWLAGAAAVFAAHLVFGVTGFGTGLVALAFLPFIMPPSEAVVLLTILTIIFAVVIFVPLRRDFTPRAIAGLIAGSILGTPLGVWVLAVAPPLVVSRLIGLVLIVIVVLEFAGWFPKRLRGAGWGVGAGVLAGVLGGAVGFPGPPTIIYGATQDWSPRTFKANLQAFFLVNQGVILAGYALAGLLTSDVVRLTGLYLAPALVGTLAGMRLFHHVDPARFRRLVFALLFVSGVALLARG